MFSLPSPLHPLIVHMPMALTILIPLFAIGALVAIRRQARVPLAWGMTIAMLALLLVSGWVALQTGETEEDKVERFVNEDAVEEHEEAGTQFVYAAGAVLLLSGVGLIRGRTGAAARVVVTLATIGLVGMGYNVGHSGGGLVYGGGAAQAYSAPASGAVSIEDEDD
ncbi:MAG: hypothetical protein NUW01_17115 [Gemmatimonadaceae bacterium]|nr:hypothetical protein [Gemmatimonadaceae bacterium]